MKRGGVVTPLEVNLISRDGRQGQDPALVGGSQNSLNMGSANRQVKIQIWNRFCSKSSQPCRGLGFWKPSIQLQNFFSCGRSKTLIRQNHQNFILSFASFAKGFVCVILLRPELLFNGGSPFIGRVKHHMRW